MVFFIIRILPLLIPVLYFLISKGLFYYSDQWYWLLLAVVASNCFYFLLLKSKPAGKKIISLLIYSTIYIVVGFVFLLLLENSIIINLYLLAWSLVYFLLLEAIFHWYFATPKSTLLNLSEIIGYLNLILILFLTAALIYFYIFLTLEIYWLLLIFFGCVGFILWQLFSAYQFKTSISLSYSAIITILLTEALLALLFLPVSFYVISSTVAVFYFWLTAYALAHLRHNLNRKVGWQYFIFGIIILAVILATAAWF